MGFSAKSLAAAGALFCLVWLGRAMRGNQYFELWHALARKIELSDSKGERFALFCLDHNFGKGLHSGNVMDTSADERAKTSPITTRRCHAIRWLLWLGAARNMMVIVPIIFLTLFVLLIVLSLSSRFTAWMVIAPVASLIIVVLHIYSYQSCGTVTKGGRTRMCLFCKAMNWAKDP